MNDFDNHAARKLLSECGSQLKWPSQRVWCALRAKAVRYFTSRVKNQEYANKLADRYVNDQRIDLLYGELSHRTLVEATRVMSSFC